MAKDPRERPDASRSNNKPGIFDKAIQSLPTEVSACPKCGEKERLSGRSTQWEFIRVCLKCGFEWTGGSMNVAQMDPSVPPPMPGVPTPVEEDDQPLVQFTGPGFRDPNKNY